jgi:hypothetical protein
VRIRVFFAGTLGESLAPPISRSRHRSLRGIVRPLRGQNWVQSHFFGPHTFTRAEGSPGTTTVEFNIPPLIHGPFVLTADGEDVTSLRVELNGVQILDDNHFRGHTSHSIDVPLEASNTLFLKMGDRQGESVTIGVSGYQYALSTEYSGLETMQPAPRATTSVEIDWRQKGAVGPVENEGQCGSDWAFSRKARWRGSISSPTGLCLLCPHSSSSIARGCPERRAATEASRLMA